jgi:PAS domain-containing protein
MSGSFKRRRRTGSTSARYQPSQLVPVESVRPGRIGAVELAAGGAVTIVAGALIALIWMLTMWTVQDQQTEIRDREERALAAQAATFAETVGHELLMIDQSLIILQAAWTANSDAVDLTKWQASMPALTAVADDLFIADDQHIIRQDIIPKAVGQGIGSAYVNFPHGSLEQLQSDGTRSRDSLLLQGDGGQPVEGRQFLMYVVRPLDHPPGWIIGASYRSAKLTKLFAEASLGYNAVVALTDTKRGAVQSIVGPAARRPQTDIAKSPLFAAISRSPAGLWLGVTAIDGVERMHAFHRIADRDMVILVAVNWAEVMAITNDLASSARWLAFGGSGLVLVIAGLVFWEVCSVRGNQRQKRVFDRTRSELDRLRAAESALTARAQLCAARLKIVVDSTSDGIALLDASLRIVQWNALFQRGIGVELRQDMPLDHLLRAQAGLALFDPGEAEINRRLAVLQSGDVAGVPQPGLILRGLPIGEAGLMVLLNGLGSWHPSPALPPQVEQPPVVPEAVVATPIEW